MDKITLGIPIYNAAPFIERTLLSALNQTYPHIEYLLVDDKGNSMDIVRRVVESHPRRAAVRIIDQKVNQGIAVARNAIFEQATGNYVFTMDCDDIITPDCIQILYDRMSERPVDFVAASFVRVDELGREYAGCQYNDTLIVGDNYPVARYRYEQGNPLFVATWNKLYSRAFVEQYHIRCCPGHYNEDPWFTYQVVLSAHSCRLLPDVTLYYTYNPHSVSGISAAHGYLEVIARQFVEVQLLKSDYISRMTEKTIYRSLLVDIMQMSLYHIYRILVSGQLSENVKDELASVLIKRFFVLPVRKGGGHFTFKYICLRSFYALPVWTKMLFMRLSVWIRLKDRLRRWVYYNN